MTVASAESAINSELNTYESLKKKRINEAEPALAYE